MTRTVGILQARLSSTRLPGKVLAPILGKPMIFHQIDRLNRCRELDDLVVATSTSESDTPLAEQLLQAGIKVYRGEQEDVLDRIYHAAKQAEADTVVRLTGDCPLTDPELIDQLIKLFQSDHYDYVNNMQEPSFPDGLDAEVMSFKALESAWKKSQLPSEREHVTLFIRNHPDQFQLGFLKGAKDLSSLRWTVDDPRDLEVITMIYEKLYPQNPQFGTTEVLELLEQFPSIAIRNSTIPRDEGLRRSEIFDRYSRSGELHRRACSVIPLGSQTFSKSKTQFPVGVSPLLIERAEGCKVWDVDHNEYLDFGSSLGAITLGYTDTDIISAVTEQLHKGTIYPLPHVLETEVAEELINVVPCAEMVRFGKNGSDVTTGAIRLARAYTKRDKVLTIGYHGWHDWYIGVTPKDLGVPQAVKSLSFKVPFNDIDALDSFFGEHGDGLAAIILEPMNREYPASGYLEHLQSLCRRYGAVLIFDEMITGFRYALGGAQELFGITPDLATFGKGIANGYPLSAIVGRGEIMKLMEEVFFSFTFGGETLSLAAALATLKKYQREPVLSTIHGFGEQIIRGVKDLITRHELEEVVSINGHPSWTLLEFRDSHGYSSWQIRTLFFQEIYLRGILHVGSHFPNYSHSADSIHNLLRVYEEVFDLIGKALKNRVLDKILHVKPLEPLFRIR